MTYENFKNELLQKLSEKANASDVIGNIKFYADGMVAETDEDKLFVKSTNIRYSKIESYVLQGDFIDLKIITREGMRARFEVKYLHDSFLENGWDFVWEIVDNNIKYSMTVDFPDIINSADNFDAIKERLILRPLNYTDNRYAFNDYIYKRVGDMVLVLYLFMEYTEEQGLSTVKVNKRMFEKWDKSLEEVMEIALINSNVRFVPRMYNTPQESYKPKYGTGAYMSLESQCKLATGMMSSIFTTFPYTNGAISFWYPGVKEKIAEMAGGDYYIAFTGIHDFHVHPVGSISPRQVLAKLKNMNKVNPEGEILSRKVYQYIAETKELKALEL